MTEFPQSISAWARQTFLALYAPRARFLALLAQGWTLPFVVEPMPGAHGRYSILLTRSDR